MFRFLILVTVSSVITTAEDLPNLGIIGGMTAAPGQFPFQVAIEYLGKQHCGGSIIAPNIILTAAHCVHRMNTRYLSVLAGTNNRLSGGERAGIASYKIHENYAQPSVAFDIAIIVLDKSFTYTKTLRAVKLVAKDEKLMSHKIAKVSGWGTEYHAGPPTNELNYVSIPLWNRDHCKKYVPYLPSTHLCAGDAKGQRNSCPGDSGGPLSMDDQLVGIVSAGFGCAAHQMPALYTFVGALRDWIKEHSGV